MSVTKVSAALMEAGTKGADIASTGTMVIGTDGSYFDITGTTGITAMTVDVGRIFTLQFDGAVVLTHSSTLYLAGAANFTTEANDHLTFVAVAANDVRQIGAGLKDGGSPVAAGGGVDSITDNGTEEAINIDSNEIVTMPKQPGFDAYVNAGQTDKTGDGTAFAITGAIWGELSDKNADFSNGTFTAPISGLYSFTAMLSLGGTTTSTTMIDFNLVFSNADRRIFLSNDYGSVTGTNFIITGALIAFMDAADTVSLLVTASGTGKLVDIGALDDSRTTRFSGVLLP